VQYQYAGSVGFSDKASGNYLFQFSAHTLLKSHFLFLSLQRKTNASASNSGSTNNNSTTTKRKHKTSTAPDIDVLKTNNNNTKKRPREEQTQSSGLESATQVIQQQDSAVAVLTVVSASNSCHTLVASITMPRPTDIIISKAEKTKTKLNVISAEEHDFLLDLRANLKDFSSVYFSAHEPHPQSDTTCNQYPTEDQEQPEL
jgi:hypothetical protein